MLVNFNILLNFDMHIDNNGAIKCDDQDLTQLKRSINNLGNRGQPYKTFFLVLSLYFTDVLCLTHNLSCFYTRSRPKV